MTTVCVLVISNKCGDDVFVCADYGVAYRQLERYVDEQWDESMSYEGEVPEKPKDVDEKIEWYFEVMGYWESYETFPDEEVIGAGLQHTETRYSAILGVIAGLRERAESIEYTCTGDTWDNMELIEEMARDGLGQISDDQVLLRMPSWAWDLVYETLSMDAASSSFSVGLRVDISRALKAIEVLHEV